MEIFAGIELIIYFAVFIGAQLYSLVQFSLQSQGKLFCFCFLKNLRSRISLFGRPPR